MHAELDGMQQHLQRQFELPLRWDNIEGAPEWVAGQSPRYHLSDGLHFVTLKPGEYTTVRVPRGAYLRLYQPTLDLAHDEVNVQQSNGSGLYVNLPAIISDDGHSLMSNVDMSQPNLIRVSRAETHQQEIKLALFISRFTTVEEVVPYRDVVALPLPTLRMRRSDQAASQTYWQLQAQETSSPIFVEGPARYVFEHRLVYPEKENQIQQAYRISAYLNGEPYQTTGFETATERSASVYVNWRKQMMGKLETGFLNIPQGRHELQLSTTATIYGRLIQQMPADYLIPQLNQPDVIDNEIFQQGIKAPNQSVWSLDQQQIKQGAVDDSTLPAEKEYLAQRLARDNSHREGGMHAVMLMRNSAIDHLHDEKLQVVANEALSFNTFYRNLLPHTKSDAASQSVKWFMSQQLHNLGEQSRSALGNEQHLRNMLSRLSHGFFVDVLGDETIGHQQQNQQSSCELSNCYYLPSRAGSGILRVVVDLDESSNESPLMVQIGDAKPIIMQVNTRPELVDSEYVENLASIGLELLQERLQSIGLAPTMDGAFARRHMHAPLAQVGLFEFEVPANTRHVRIWKLGSPANAVRVALQYRTSKPSSFSEMEYLAAAQQFSYENNIYHQFIGAYSQKQSRSIIEKELANHWLPLMRFLKSQSQLYLSSIVNQKPLLTNENNLDRKDIDQLREKAELAQMQGQWLVALEIWSNIREGSMATQVIQRQADQ
ncbi:MAG: hypothetical protein OEX82_03585, partial [Nitrosomonas sp.]|nr:hypothetical protein [Nitrosomonas sp.]